MENKLWINKDCEMCIEVQTVLEDNNIPYRVRENLDVPPTETEILELIYLMEEETKDLLAHEFVNMTEKEFKELDDKEIANLLINKPALMNVPIYQTADSAIQVTTLDELRDFIKNS